MCGIAGYFGNKKSQPSSRNILNCQKVMAKRGPDNQAHIIRNFRDKSLCLLHSRLSIIDISAEANQPFSDSKSDIVFNGEIYNYKQIKKVGS